MKQGIYLILSFFVIVSCKSKTNYEPLSLAGDKSYVESALEDVPVARKVQGQSFEQGKLTEEHILVQRKIIKDGTLNFEVVDLQESKKKVDGLVKKYGGYYSNEVLNNTDYSSNYELNVRVPSNNFELFVEELEEGTGEITYKHVNARDVTEEFVDLESRLENKRSYLQRYRDLLKKANTIKEILEIEEKIRTLEEEIESVEGRLKYLNDQVDFSSLEINLNKQKEYKYTPGRRANFWQKLKRSFSRGWFGFIDFLLALINLWPFLIILAIGIYFFRKYQKRRKAKKS